MSIRPELIAVWGVSGAGKSTYLGWLRDKHGYSFVEHDEVAGGRGAETEADRDWLKFARAGSPPAAS